MGSPFHLIYWGPVTVFLTYGVGSIFLLQILYLLCISCIDFLWITGYRLSQPSLQLQCSLSCHLYLYHVDLCTIHIYLETSCRHHFPGLCL